MLTRKLHAGGRSMERSLRRGNMMCFGDRGACRLGFGSSRLFVALCSALAFAGFVLAHPGSAAATSPDPKKIAALMETSNEAVQRVQDVSRRVFRLLVETETTIKGGTAFLVSGRRIIATNHHVVDKGTAFAIGLVGDKGLVKRIPARVIAIYPQKDLALLEALDDLPGGPLTLATDIPGSATDLFAIGFPAAADPQGTLSWTRGDDETFFLPSVLKGYVSRVLTNRWFSSQLQHQTPIIPGYSGGPLIDNSGSVVAISSSIHKEANGISYGVLALDLADFLSACQLPINVVNASYRPAIRNPTQNTMSEVARSLASRKKVITDPGDRAMLARANDFLDRGDIFAARLLFDYLVKNRDIAEAYAGLAKTYDPMFLNNKNVIGVSGDAIKAREFYEKAAQAGSLTLETRLAMDAGRTTGGCDGSVCRLINEAEGPIVSCEHSDPLVLSNSTVH
jgi:S1-C subfamily serine protease